MLMELCIYLRICPSSRFTSIVLWPRWLTLCQCYLKMHALGEGSGATLWVLRHFLSLISRLLVAIQWQPTPVLFSGKSHGWRSLVGHRVTQSRTQLSDFTFTFHFHALEKEMATHSTVLAWRIPGTVEPGGLPSMGSHRVGHNWSDLAAVAAATLQFPGIST